MKPCTSLLAATTVSVAATLLVACGGGGGGGYDSSAPPASTPPTVPPPVSSQTNFTAFMRGQATPTATTDAALPVDVETIDWAFTDDDNETAYDDIITASM